MNLISRYSDIPGLVIDESKIPDEIRGLLALAVEWNIADYLELEAYIDAAPEPKRRHFIESFAPHFDFITSWVEQSAHFPMPDEAAIFNIAAGAATRVRQASFAFETNSPHSSQFDFTRETGLIGAN